MESLTEQKFIHVTVEPNGSTRLVLYNKKIVLSILLHFHITIRNPVEFILDSLLTNENQSTCKLYFHVISINTLSPDINVKQEL